MPTASLMRSCAQASTSASSSLGCASVRVAGRRPCRAVSVAVFASDAFCRDKVGTVRTVESKGKVYKVTFVGAGGETKEIDCPDNQYILDAAEAGGLDLPATCRGGICGACVARVASGKVDQSDVADLAFTVNEEEQAKGMTLICMARAESDLVIETQSDWGYSLGNEWKGATGKFSAAPEPLVGKKWTEMK